MSTTTGVLAALGVSGAALGVHTARTAVPPADAVPDRAGYLRRWASLHGGYDPSTTTWTRTWLGLTYQLGAPLARRGVQPTALTAWGVWAAAASLAPVLGGGRWTPLAIVPLVGSGLLDNLDGCVAALTNRASGWGFVVDSLADRVADGCYLMSLRGLGAPTGLCLAAGTGTYLLEYTRARAGHAGMREIGVVTLGERPTRVVLHAVTLLSAGRLPSYAVRTAAAGAAAQLAVTAVGLAQLLRVVARRLGGVAAAEAS